jgi:hypothetical protein
MGFFDEFSLTAFAPYDRERLAGAFVLDSIAEDTDSPHAAIFDCSMGTARERGFLNGRVASVALSLDAEPRAVLLQQWGAVHALVGDELVATPAIDASRGPLMRLRNRFGALYAVGSASQVYRSHALDAGWTAIGPEGEGATRLSILTDIDGFSHDELYASGTQGSLWRLEAGVWTHIPCATNLSFHAIHCCEDGYVYACGQLGLLARGRGDRFDLLSPGTDPLVDLWGIAGLAGTIYCSGFRALLRWTGDSLVPHMPAMRLSPYFHALETREGVLWSCGEKSLLRYDGLKWEATHDLRWIPADA